MGRDRAELIEREGDLDRIASALDSAMKGLGAGVLVRGSAGIGKSALLDACGDLARARGMRVFAARGGLLEHEFVFGVVRQLFAPIGADALLADDVPAPAVPDGHFSLTYSIFWALLNAAAEGPVCVLVDDLHWADEPSVRVLDFVLRRIHDAPVAVVCALRSGEPGAADGALAGLTELEAERFVQVVEPTPFSPAGVAELAARTFGVEVEPPFASACHRRTAGSPFLVSELLRELLASGVAPTSAAADLVESSLPSRTGRIVLARLGRLGSDCVDLARAVAVLADHALLADAAELAQLPPVRSAAAAEALIAAGLVGSSESGLSFVHPLMRDAVEADMSHEVVAYWHARAAMVLAERARDPQLIAAHLLRSPATADTRTVHWLRAAARIAATHAAPDEAITMLRRALAEPPYSDQLRDVLFELGSAEAVVGAPDAVTHLERARELSIGPEARAEVTLVLARAFMLSGQSDAVYSAVAQSRVELGDGIDEVTLALHAIELITKSLDASRPTPSLTDRRRLAGLRGRTIAERSVLACVAFDNARRAMPIAATNALIEQVFAGGGLAAADGADPFMTLTLVTAIQWSGRLADALRLTDDVIDHARDVNSAMVFAEALASRAMTRWRAGALDLAEADARQSLEIEGALRRNRSPVAVAALSRVLVDRGRAPLALDLIRSGPESGLPNDHVIREIVLTSLGRVQIALHRYEDALASLREAGRVADGVGTVNPAASDWRVRAAEAAHALGRVSEAREMIAAALRHARMSGGPVELGPTLRTAALIDETQALELLRESTDVLQDAGLDLEMAYTRAALGACLHRGGNSQAAREPLEAAMDTAQRCGAIPLALKARADLVAAGGRPRRWQRSGVDALTPSERRVVNLAMAGTPNRQIAQHLFLSTRTVEAHLRNAYRKLGVTSRSDLAQAVAPALNAG